MLRYLPFVPTSCAKRDRSAQECGLRGVRSNLKKNKSRRFFQGDPNSWSLNSFESEREAFQLGFPKASFSGRRDPKKERGPESNRICLHLLSGLVGREATTTFLNLRPRHLFVRPFLPVANIEADQAAHRKIDAGNSDVRRKLEYGKGFPAREIALKLPEISLHDEPFIMKAFG
jgi:hypothetical protein